MGFLTKILHVNRKVCVCVGEPDANAKTNEEPVTCSICLDDQKQPFLSSCNHSFCVSCIVRAARFNGTSNFPCPLCRTTITNMADAIETESATTVPFLLSNYPPPEEVCFEFISDIHNRNMISSAYMVVSRLNKWNVLYNFLPNLDQGFMFTKHEEILSIMNQIDEEPMSGHSGCSMGFTMRNIHFIARYGYHEFQNEWCKWS